MTTHKILSDEEIKKLKKQLSKSVLIEDVEKEFVKIWNKRNDFIQNPDNIKTKEINGQGYYNAHQIDTLDNQLWFNWLKLLQKLKSLKNA